MKDLSELYRGLRPVCLPLFLAAAQCARKLPRAVRKVVLFEKLLDAHAGLRA